MIGAVTSRLVQQPRERDRGRLLAELGAELLPPLELRAHRFVARVAGSCAARCRRRLLMTAEHPARERAPRDHAEAVVAARGEHFELDGARREVVEALLAHEAEEVARLRGFVRLRDVPAREVAAADVERPCPARRASPSPATPRPTARSGRCGASGRGRCDRSAAGCRLASHAARMWRAERPPSFGQSVIGPNTFVASTTFSRRPPPCANQWPMIVSVAPGTLRRRRSGSRCRRS